MAKENQKQNESQQDSGLIYLVLSKKAVEEIKESLNEVKELIRGKAKEETEGRWIESEEARKLLGVSPKTWQTYRDSRVIPFSQFGRKIYVKKADIETFLQSHLIRTK